MDKNKKLATYISLFSGAGVGCYGFNLEEFDCIATCELLDKRMRIQRCNNTCRYPSGYIVGDLGSDDIKEKVFLEVDKWKKKGLLKEVDVIIATPPCQGMSVANHKKKNELKRNSLVVESIKFVNEIKPKFFIFENVRAFLKTQCTDIDNENKSIKETIELNLANKYNILYKIVNFKDYGVPSSRTRTLVIGVRKDLKEITPYDIFPDQEAPKTLRELIGDLPSLKVMGEIYENDVYHSFRSYDPRMLDWIKDLKEGQSAFENDEASKRPHRVVNGDIVPNKNKNGDKYKRWYWDRIGPCIHTRNDILSSQSTIHPMDDRVFSIRELMRMMSIPDSFRWLDVSDDSLKKMTYKEKKSVLSKNEMNIRHSIGESVPTKIVQSIARKIRIYLKNNCLIEKYIHKLIEDENLTDFDQLRYFIKSNIDNYTFTELSKISELANSKRLHHAAYYTRQDICFTVIKDLPEAVKFKNIRILEPAVGAGNFLPLLIQKYGEVPDVTIDLVDIDPNVLSLVKDLITKLKIPSNIKINFINDDFLTHSFQSKYDIVVGNPPFKKIVKQNELLESYRKNRFNRKTNNMFSFFIERSLELANYVALITPKSLLSTPELNKTRQVLEKQGIIKICDYGEAAFNVKIETISIICYTKQKKYFKTKIESYITKEIKYQDPKYIFSNEFPYWLLYRDEFFDNVANKLELGVFDAFRDRQITKKMTKNVGRYRVLKSRNLSREGELIDTENDCYIDDISGLAVSKFLNKSQVVIVPNLSYYPRANFLPKDSITDGSLALLQRKDKNIKITDSQLDYYSSKEFERFYKIARNFGTRSLNVDKNSVYFWGLRQ